MGLFQTLIINYEITGVIFLKALLSFSINFCPGCDQCLIFCCFSIVEASLRLPNSEAEIT